MIQKKVCLLGTSGVGKTSLVAQFVHSMFSEKYLTTVGVKIDKKTVPLNGTEVTLVLWDLAGDAYFQRLLSSSLRGTSGYLLVADGPPGLPPYLPPDLPHRVAARLRAGLCAGPWPVLRLLRLVAKPRHGARLRGRAGGPASGAASRGRVRPGQRRCGRHRPLRRLPLPL